MAAAAFAADNARMQPELRAVSLDLDNTLWDVVPVLKRAEQTLQQWLERHYPLIPRQFAVDDLQRLRLAVASEHPGRAHELSWLRTEALKRAAIAAGYPASVAREAFEVFSAARNDIEPFAEVPAALARLAARVPLYAVSNGNASVQRVGLGDYFRDAIGAEQAGAAKPDARIFARLLEVADAAACMVLHVGDDALADVAGARAAGLRTAWMNRGGREWPAGAAPADYEVADLVELAELVERLTAAH
jgi:HAD superfamily hydrolase (TIGR01549 family)